MVSSISSNTGPVDHLDHLYNDLLDFQSVGVYDEYHKFY